jgi:chemotaxis protein MotB
MARKKKKEEHENLERWLVSYADFITLLFAFFVVMYSISSVNEGKFRVLSQSIVAAFNPSSYSARKIEVGPTASTSSSSPSQIKEVALLKEAFGELHKDKVSVFQDGRGVVVRMSNAFVFPSGSSEILPEAADSLEQIAKVLVPLPNSIRVEGHTDDVPINTALFPSNWELSAARAINIVKLLTRMGVEPSRQEAVGYGEYRPIASNDSPEGQGMNRRVEVVILKPEDSPSAGSTLLRDIVVR